MKRVAGVILSWGLVLFALSPMAIAAQGVISVSPASGPAGTNATVIISGFLQNAPVEVHAGSIGGALLGTGTTNGSGIAGIPITIPASAPPGPFALYACSYCSSEIPANSATTTFDVTEPPPTTTATTEAPPPPPADDPPPPSEDPPPPEDPPPAEEPGEEAPPPEEPPAEEPPPVVEEPEDPVPTLIDAGVCEYPESAVFIDFDEWDLTYGDSEDLFGDLQDAMLDARHPIYFHQWDTYEIRFEEPDDDNPNVLVDRRFDSIGWVTENPARSRTSSAPSAMRLVGDTHWTMFSGWGDLTAQPDYFGFTIGFDHFPDGFDELADQEFIEVREGWDTFDTPDEVEVELRVTTMPMTYGDGTVVDQGAWDPVTVTLGLGPQPVTRCVIAENTLGELDEKTLYLVDIVATTPSGDPLDIALDIDDVFYASDIPTYLLPAPAILGSSSISWLLWLAIAIAVLIIMAGVYYALRRRDEEEEDSPPPPPPPPPQE